MYVSDSLETILHHLSARVMNIITDGNCLQHLEYLLEFLAAWEKRPAYIIPMAYQWCSTIAKAVERLGQRDVTLTQPWPELVPGLRLDLRARLQIQQKDPAFDWALGSSISTVEGEFSEVGPGCDPVHLDNTLHHSHRYPQNQTPNDYEGLLFATLWIGFRLVTPGFNQPALHLDHTSHHSWVFETVFSSEDDEAIADAVCAWIAGGDNTPAGSFMCYFIKRVEKDKAFSPRLWQMSVCAIECIGLSELEVSGWETVCLMNYLEVDVDDVVEKHRWVVLLVDVICSPAGQSLSSHYWHLLDKLVSVERPGLDFVPHDLGVMKTLKETGDWEKLEVWTVVVWESLALLHGPISGSKDVEEVTLELLSQRPSAIPRFENLYPVDCVSHSCVVELQSICDQAQAKQLPSESPLL